MSIDITNSAEEEGENRLAYQIASDELQRVSVCYFSGRLGQQEFSVVAPSDDRYGSETLDPHCVLRSC